LIAEIADRGGWPDCRWEDRRVGSDLVDDRYGHDPAFDSEFLTELQVNLHQPHGENSVRGFTSRASQFIEDDGGEEAADALHRTERVEVQLVLVALPAHAAILRRPAREEGSLFHGIRSFPDYAVVVERARTVIT
jgi:hypothetical protein